jgi:hypothetical protein
MGLTNTKQQIQRLRKNAFNSCSGYELDVFINSIDETSMANIF